MASVNVPLNLLRYFWMCMCLPLTLIWGGSSATCPLPLALGMRWIRCAARYTSFDNIGRAFECNLRTSQVRMCACSGMNGVRRLHKFSA
jgi:hypothetical protein